MFNSATAYRIIPTFQYQPEAFAGSIGAQLFVPCGPTQERSVGFVEPRNEKHGALVEVVAGQIILALQIETKSVPAALIKRKVDEKAAQIEAATGRKPGKREKKEMKEDVTRELLPMAFSKLARVPVWIDPAAMLAVVGTSSQSVADDAVTALCKSIDGFGVTSLMTALEPAGAMSSWLREQEAPAWFSIDRDCELKATDESKSVVRYANHALDIEEVRQHIEGGKRPTRLGMTFSDKVSFELTANLQLRKIEFLDGVFEGSGGNSANNFDADVAIQTGELSKLIPSLLDALGGESKLAATEAEAS